MANYHGLLPEQSEAIVDPRGVITRNFRDFLADLATTTSDAALQAQITALDTRVAALEDGGGDLATFVAGVGISIIGQITDPIIRISLNAYLGDLLNVDDVTVPPADGDALVYDLATETWGPKAVLLNPMTTEGDIIVADVGGLPIRLGIGATDQVLGEVAGVPAYVDRVIEVQAGTNVSVDNTDPMRPVVSASGAAASRGITITGGAIGGSVIPVAQVIGGLAASDYTLTGNWYLWCSPVGAIELDVRRTTFGALPPGPGDSICGGNEPAVSGAISDSGTFAGWSTSITRDDALSVVVNSVTDVTWFVLLLEAA